jgi:hypothetical protein
MRGNCGQSLERRTRSVCARPAESRRPASRAFGPSRSRDALVLPALALAAVRQYDHVVKREAGAGCPRCGLPGMTLSATRSLW